MSQPKKPAATRYVVVDESHPAYRRKVTYKNMLKSQLVTPEKPVVYKQLGVYMNDPEPKFSNAIVNRLTGETIAISERDYQPTERDRKRLKKEPSHVLYIGFGSGTTEHYVQWDELDYFYTQEPLAEFSELCDMNDKDPFWATSVAGLLFTGSCLNIFPL